MDLLWSDLLLVEKKKSNFLGIDIIDLVFLRTTQNNSLSNLFLNYFTSPPPETFLIQNQYVESIILEYEEDWLCGPYSRSNCFLFDRSMGNFFIKSHLEANQRQSPQGMVFIYRIILF